MIKCPNITHPDWKALVNKYGENAAWKKYIENGEKIPSIEGVKKSRGKKIINRVVDGFHQRFKTKDTLDSMLKHPLDASKMIDELNSRFPWVQVFKDRIIDENGEYLNIPAGKQGQHYRNAFLSAVAWSNDSSMEIPPHEYAHEYIDMYRETDIVKKAIEKYGEERLVTLIARKYAGQKMSNSFEKFLQKFWSLIKNTFGSESIVDILTDSFSKNEKLGPQFLRETPIRNFAAATGPMLGKNTVVDEFQDIPGVVDDNRIISKSGMINSLSLEFKKNKVFGGEEISNEIEVGKVQNTSTLIKIKDSFKSAIDNSIIKLKNSKNLNDLSSRITKFNKPLLNSITQSDAIKKIGKIQSDGKLFKLTNDSQYYEGKGLKLERQSNFVARVVGKSVDVNSDLKKGASVGNLIDLIGRGVFDGDVKSLDYYIKESNIQNQENGYRLKMSQQEFENTVASLNILKDNMESKGMKIIANDVFVYREYTEEEKKNTKVQEQGLQGVGGTLDLVAVDKNGDTHIVDFKNIKLTKENKIFLEKNIFEGGTFKGEFQVPKTETWADQQSTYQMLMESNGLPVASTNILPISTTYESDSNEESIDVRRFNNWWNSVKEKKDKVLVTDQNQKVSSDYSAVDPKVIKRIDRVINEVNPESILNIIKKIRGDELSLTKFEQSVFDNIIEVVIAISHKNKISESYLSDDGKFIVKGEVVEKKSIEEISNQNKQRENNRKSKNNFIRWISKKTDLIITQVTNNSLWSKYLSGSEDSTTSSILDKGLLRARGLYETFSTKFIEIIEVPSSKFTNSSIYYDEKANIDDLETNLFKLDNELNENHNVREIKLTKAEQLMVYLMDRQDTGRVNMNEGIHIAPINGRNIESDINIRLTNEQIGNIVEDMSKDKDAIEIVKAIDSATSISYESMNPIFKALEGYDMPKIKNYFPMFHGGKQTGVPTTKNVIANVRSLRARDGSGPIRLEDPFKVLDSLEKANSSYVAYAIPIHNAQKLMNKITKEFSTNIDGSLLTSKRGLLNEIQGTINMLQDSGLMFSSQGQQGFQKYINKLQGNFAVAHLSKNLGVVLKQMVSLETASAIVPREFIKKSGLSLGWINLVNPYKLLKNLSYTGIEGGDTKMPIEWDKTMKDPDYQELLEDPLTRVRFEGKMSRESGETVMAKRTSDDIVDLGIPGLKKLKISKNRLMLGITIMDRLTILRIYKAIKLWTESRMSEPDFSNLTLEEIKTHNINMLQYAIDKTQPTFDIANRSGFARNPNPIARHLTMFSSATQKMYGVIIDAMVDYNNNPNPESLKYLFWRLTHTALTTSAMLATINAVWYGLGHGWDDDDWDSLPQRYAWESLKTMTGVPIVGQAISTAVSNLDDNPWSVNIQDPFSNALQKTGESVANLYKGNIYQATKGLTDVYFSSKGLPMVPISKTATLSKKFLDEN